MMTFALNTGRAREITEERIEMADERSWQRPNVAGDTVALLAEQADAENGSSSDRVFGVTHPFEHRHSSGAAR
jgi:hypothetical protein